MAAGWRCWGCLSQVLGSCGTAPVPPGWGCCSQHLVLAHGCSHGVCWAGCRAFGPDGSTGSGFAGGRAQGGWSGCCPEAQGSRGTALMPHCRGCWSPVPGSRGTALMPHGYQCWGWWFAVLGSCRSTPMPPGCRCWGWWCPVPASCGTAPALPGWACCSQRLVLAHGSHYGVFWAGCRDFGPDVVIGSGLVPAQAQGGWSSCCPEVLGSHRRTSVVPGWQCWDCCSAVLEIRETAPMPPGYRCWGCWSPVPGSRGKALILTGWQCWGRRALSWHWRL